MLSPRLTSAALLAAGLLGFGLTQTAFAEVTLDPTITSYNVKVSKGLNPEGGDQVTKGGSGTGTTTASVGPASGAATVTATSMEHGSLGGSVEASGNLTASGPSHFVNSKAQLRLASTDTLTITSDSLANGTEVTFDIIIALDRDISVSGNGASGRASASFTAPDSFEILFDSLPDVFGFGPAPDTLMFAYTTTVGAEFDIEFAMSLIAEVDFNTVGTSSASVLAGNTANLFINARGDNFGFNSESGATYTLPVPEPETWGMLLAGLGLVGFAARRKLHQRA